MKNFFRTVDLDVYRKRLILLLLMITAAFAVLFSRLFFLQIIEGSDYLRLSANNCIRLQDIDPLRGLIFDRNGKCMVDNRPSFDLTIIPRDAGKIDDTLATLAEITGFTFQDLKSSYSKNKKGGYQPILLSADVSRDVLAAVMANKFDMPGVIIHLKPLRHYLYDRFAAHLIGYLGEISKKELEEREFTGYEAGCFVGKCGVERAFDRHLRGRKGGSQVEVNANGQVKRILKTVPAEAGNSIYLTIDFELQKKAEALLEGLCGAVVALDPLTGEVLALCSSPAFDQNSFISGLSGKAWRELVSDPRKPLSNKAIQAEYPPGSTYKIVTALAGLQERLISPAETFFCPGYYQYGDRLFRCWKEHGHGQVGMVNALAQSCDVYFYQLGQRAGVERLAWYAKGCGLGRPTGIDLFGEKAGLIPSEKWKRSRLKQPWYSGETLSVAIGQGYNLVTPIQMAVLAAAVANGGMIKKPLIMKKIETMDGIVVENGRTTDEGRLPVDPAALAVVREGLWKVVNEPGGTAYYRVHDEALDISGKTGTAQVVASPKEKDGRLSGLVDAIKPHAWFIAYAPSVNPKIAMAVVVERGGHGSSVAAPIAREMISMYLNGSPDPEHCPQPLASE
ncbi:MAG: penicillin-binding protein 2 [Thermodesulfobacteriota bacterium]